MADRPIRVSILGAGGAMGLPMAKNIAAAGFYTVVWNRTANANMEQLKAAGNIQVANSAEEAVANADIVLSMLAHDAAVEAVFTPALLQKIKSGAVHVCCSTISPALAKKLSQIHTEHQQLYASCPVFGRPDAAAAKRLIAVLAGPPAARAAVHHVMAATSGRVAEVGDLPEQANVVKLSGNFMIMSALESMGEAFALLEKAGVPREVTYDILCAGFFSSAPVYSGYGKMVAAQDYASNVGFTATLGLKDANLVLQAADALRVPMPLASLVHGRLLSAIAHGGAEQDWACLASRASEDAGLPSGKKEGGEGGK